MGEGRVVLLLLLPAVWCDCCEALYYWKRSGDSKLLGLSDARRLYRGGYCFAHQDHFERTDEGSSNALRFFEWQKLELICDRAQ